MDAGRLLQAAGSLDEGQSRRPRPMRRWSRSWRRSASSRARTSTSPNSIRPWRGRLRACAQGGLDKIMADVKDRRQARQRLDCSRPRPAIYGTDYLYRARSSPLIGLGANRPQDAVYPTSRSRRDGKPLQRREQVRDALRQGADSAGERLLVADHVQRRVFLRRQPAQPLHPQRTQRVSSPTPTARSTLHPEGRPGPDKEANWLPAPEGEFVLMLPTVLAEGNRSWTACGSRRRSSATRSRRSPRS